MFTGIIEEIGTIESIKKGAHSATLTIHATTVLADVKIGDSIAVNGVCLTVTDYKSNYFTADVMHETLNRSSLRLAKPGFFVNLERAMPAYGRFDGHIVEGHVDGIGTITSIKKDDNAIWFTIQTTSEIMRYIVEKGAIAIDGISLTVAKVTSDSFCVSVIPHTADKTCLKHRKIGDNVNLENDIIGKYIEKFLQPQSIDNNKKGLTQEKHTNTLTMEKLSMYGYS